MKGNGHWGIVSTKTNVSREVLRNFTGTLTFWKNDDDKIPLLHNRSAYASCVLEGVIKRLWINIYSETDSFLSLHLLRTLTGRGVGAHGWDLTFRTDWRIEFSWFRDFSEYCEAKPHTWDNFIRWSIKTWIAPLGRGENTARRLGVLYQFHAHTKYKICSRHTHIWLLITTSHLIMYRSWHRSRNITRYTMPLILSVCFSLQFQIHNTNSPAIMLHYLKFYSWKFS